MRKKAVELKEAETVQQADTDEVEKATGMAETEDAVKVQVEVKETAEVKKIYIGPTIKGMVHGTVIKGELPPLLQEAIAEMPVIGELVIPLTDIVTANKNLSNPKSAFSKFHKMAQGYSKGEKRS